MFADASALTTVTFAADSQLTSIGKGAFDHAISLTAITIPAGVKSIGERVFYYASSLATITFAAGSQLTSIGESAFEGANALTAITIPAGVTSIGTYAFYPGGNRIGDDTYKANKLATVTFATGSQLTSIGNSAFEGANALTAITIPVGVTSIGNSAFYRASSLVTVTFAAGSRLTSIENYTFEGAIALTAITIPAGVKSIGSNAFAGAIALRSVYFLADKPTLASDAFAGVSGASAYIRSTATGYPTIGSLMNGLTIAVGVYTLTYKQYLRQSRRLAGCPAVH